MRGIHLSLVDSPKKEPVLYKSFPSYGIIMTRWNTQDMNDFNSLGPSDAIRWQRSRWTLGQVMACCLIVLSHYLNQCWLFISKNEWHSSKGKFTRDNSAINHRNYLENQVPKIPFKFPRGQWVKILMPGQNDEPLKTHIHWHVQLNDLPISIAPKNSFIVV